MSEQDCINLTGRKGIYSFLKDGKHETQNIDSKDLDALKLQSEKTKQKRKKLEEKLAMLEKKTIQ